MARIPRLRGTAGGLLAVAVAAALLAPSADGGAGSRAREASDLARAAGCVLERFPAEGLEHTQDPVEYETNPPTSGPHHPLAARDGRYAPGGEPRVEKWVHSLEHGRVLIQYAPGSSARRVQALASVFDERFHGRRRYHQLLFRNNTEMPFAVAAVAWRRYLGCRRFNSRVPRAIRAFRAAYVDRAPELIP